MNQSSVDKIVQAVLYEGYILYPYRRSVKNHQRWTFGGLYPRSYSETQNSGDAWSLQTECIVIGDPTALLETSVRFLHLTDRTVHQLIESATQWPAGDPPPACEVDTLQINGKSYQHWQEAVERNIAVDGATIARLLDKPLRHDFTLPATREIEPLADAAGEWVGYLARQQEAIEGSAEVSASLIADNTYKITLRTWNRTAMEESSPVTRDSALLRSLVSTHAVLVVGGGEFVSLTDPPEHLRDDVEACRNVGVWPVLVGEPGQKDTMLASPIILYDYPQIAPQSPGDMFDGTEIDEILTLRVMTLTDEEKGQVDAVDDRASDMLKRTESLAREQLMNLHGEMRGLRQFPPGDIFPAWDLLENKPKLPSLSTGGVELKPGDRVRLHPKGGADALDIVLAGKTATIASIEQDYEDRIHLAVTVEDDPGADLGLTGKPGHRFFFRPDEIEPLVGESANGESE